MLGEIRQFIENRLSEIGLNVYHGEQGTTTLREPWAILGTPALEIERVHQGISDFDRITARYLLYIGVRNLQSNPAAEEKLEEFIEKVSIIMRDLNKDNGDILRADVKRGRLAELDEATNTFIYEFEIEVQFTRR